ncbi:hypothetical protein ACIQ4I_02990 [Rummeliibacillus sp. NPDC094406]|uniref:hypothetical protein n=1 Tax=Rummeliibacillus sp. NPDC094406 TaxID=3364511 RepID=UPI003823E169
MNGLLIWRLFILAVVVVLKFFSVISLSMFLAALSGIALAQMIEMYTKEKNQRKIFDKH